MVTSTTRSTWNLLVLWPELQKLMLHTPKDTPTRRFLRRLAFMVVPRSARDLKTRMYLEEYSCMPPPFFVILISMAEIAFFIYYAVDMGEPVVSNGPCPVYSPLTYNPYRRREAWRYLTYMFIHSGYVHLINNLLVQLILGIPLEMVHKWWRVILVYFSGVLVGALLTSVTDPHTYLVGASGGVYAIEYAFLGNLILNWKHFYYPWVHAVFLGVLTCVDVGFAIWDTYFSVDPSNTGHMAHLGGALAGLLVGVNVLRNLEREPWEKYCWWIAFIIFAVIILSTIVLSIALPIGSFYPYPDESPLQWHKQTF
ncbi:rhomboid-related protein 2-like isoform X2 [Oratosquilla oratoria]|uniref:rhomboid-related protein 2-like isoform X2 n=1 Tax=Oratosquilla oratoria TaxID=337810 RepID=UPI003F75BE08